MIGLAMMLALTQPTASDMAKLCLDNDTTACDFFLTGVIQAAVIATFDIKGSQRHVCVPGDASIDEVRAKFNADAAADLAAFPQDRFLPAVALVISTLVVEYGCKKIK